MAMRKICPDAVEAGGRGIEAVEQLDPHVLAQRVSKTKGGLGGHVQIARPAQEADRQIAAIGVEVGDRIVPGEV